MRVLLSVLVACGAPPDPRAQLDLRQERATLRAADSAFAARASRGLLPALRETLDEDVVFLAPGEPVRVGKAATLAMLDSDGASAKSTASWRAVRVDVSSDGRAGYTYGFGSATGPFKYIAYWKKDPTGTWRVAAYVGVPQDSTAPADPPAGFESPTARSYRPFPGTGPRGGVGGPMDADRQFAARALSGDVATAFASFAAPDGAMLSGQPGIVYGPEAIRKAFVANFPARGRILWRPVAGNVAATGDLGFTVGEAEIRTLTPSGAPRIAYTKYLTVWRRVNTGEWRYVIDGGNLRPSPPSSE